MNDIELPLSIVDSELYTYLSRHRPRKDRKLFPSEKINGNHPFDLGHGWVGIEFEREKITDSLIQYKLEHLTENKMSFWGHLGSIWLKILSRNTTIIDNEDPEFPDFDYLEIYVNYLYEASNGEMQYVDSLESDLNLLQELHLNKKKIQKEILSDFFQVIKKRMETFENFSSHRQRGPSIDILDSCIEGMKYWLDDKKQLETAAQLAGISHKTLLRWIPNVLQLQDEDKKREWIDLIRAMDKSHYLGEFR